MPLMRKGREMKGKNKKQSQSAPAKSNRRSAAKGSHAKSVLRAIAPFIILALALFFETCIILSESAGTTGVAVRRLLFGLLGHASHVLCICALLIAFFFRELSKSGTLKYKSVMALALTFTLAAFNSLAAQDGMRDATLSFKEFFESGAMGESGGAIGSFFGLILSKLLTPTVATVISIIGAAALLTFTAGITRLGLWRTFAKTNTNGSVAKKAPTAQGVAKKPPQVPSVSPSRIDTVVTGELQSVPALPEFNESPSALPELYGTDSSNEVFTEEDFDEINEGSFNAVDFNAPEQPQRVYTPVDLMEQFGLNEQEKPKVDIYDESPKPAHPSSTQRKKTSGKGGISYSPFATFKSQEEVFGSAARTRKAEATEKNSSDKAYSPFADPFRSLEEKKSTSQMENEAKLWDKIKRDAPNDPKPTSAPAAPISAPTPLAPTALSAAMSSAPFDAMVTEPIDIDYEEAQDGQAEEITVTPEQIFSAPVYEAPKPAQPAPEPELIHIIPKPAPKPAPPLARQVISSAFDDEVEAPEQEDLSSRKQRYDEEPDPRIKNPFSIYNKLRYPKYARPTTDLLDPVDNSVGISEQEIYETQSKLHTVFENFHVDASVTGYSVGPSITRYEITPGPGVKAKQITGLGDDIALALQSEKRKGDIRIVTVQGKSVMGVEVPNSVVTKVSLRALIENKDFQNAKSKITVCVGLTVSGKPIYMNIDDMPHVLVAGQTKSGKSVAINCMIISLIYRASPDEVQLILIDPKRVELSIYNDIPHMVMPVIDDPKRAAAALKWAVAEMERRYQLLNDARVRNRDEYYATRDQNPKFEYMPQIVIIIDELADLMLQVREHVEGLINRLAAMARACGMHIVIGTQRPSVDVVTGLIKANIPSHISFKVSSHTDSRVILGNVGAEKLLGRGDMLYHPTGSNQIRAQGAFVDTPEIKRILNYIIEKNGKAEYDPEVMFALQNETDKLNKVDKKIQSDDDYAIDASDIDFEYLCQATELVLNMGKATTNVIQRHLKIGFNRAANIVEKLEELGFVSAPQGSKPRDVLVDWKTYQEWRNNNGK